MHILLCSFEQVSADKISEHWDPAIQAASASHKPHVNDFINHMNQTFPCFLSVRTIDRSSH